MRLSRTVSSISAISLFSLLLTSAYSHDGGWVSDSSGKGVRDSAKQCVKSSGGNSLDCAPKVEPPPPPPPPPPVKVTPPPPPPPKPKPRPRPPQVQILNLNEAGGSNFATDSAKLRPAAIARLDDFIATVKRSRVTPSTITIIGHTDSRGSVKYNQGLSERRAQSVADYLVSQGISSNNMQVGGRGELEPVASNATRAGRAQNRRVDIRVTGQRRITR